MARGSSSAIAIVLVAAVSVGCGFRGSDRVVDGWAIGEPFDCTEFIRSGHPCAQEQEDLLKVALAGFDKREPGHARVVRATLHEEGVVRDLAGNPILNTRSGGCCDVAQFDLADGSVRTIGIGYLGINDFAGTVDYGPN